MTILASAGSTGLSTRASADTLLGNLGDMDRDATITASDALITLRMSIGMTTQSIEEGILADVDGDGNTTAGDALEILRYSVELSDGSSAVNTPIYAGEDDKFEAAFVSLGKTATSIELGKTEKLTATVTPFNAIDKSVVWTTSDSSIADVFNGEVTAKALGTATVTATTSNGKKAECVVTVKEPEVFPASIFLDKMNITLDVGQSTTLTATVSPSDTTDPTVKWSSNNPNVAEVVDGKVTAKASGPATITARTKNGLTATCVVNVKAIEVTSVKLDKSSITIKKNDTAKLCATVAPNNADDQSLRWTSSNRSVATVDNQGNVKAEKEGSTTITATSSNGISASCKVTVTADKYIYQEDLREGIRRKADYVESDGSWYQCTFGYKDVEGNLIYCWLAYEANERYFFFKKQNYQPGTQPQGFADSETIEFYWDDDAIRHEAKVNSPSEGMGYTATAYITASTLKKGDVYVYDVISKTGYFSNLDEHASQERDTTLKDFDFVIRDQFGINIHQIGITKFDVS